MSLKSVGQLKQNKIAEFELVAEAYKMLHDNYQNNPFLPNLKDNVIVWGALVPVNSKHVREVIDIQCKMNRSILINSGGHGSKQGINPTEDRLGEGQFIVEDIQIAMQSNGLAGLHIVSSGSPAVFPKNIDVLISWCYGMAMLSREDDGQIQDQVKTSEEYDWKPKDLADTQLLQSFLKVKPGIQWGEWNDDSFDRTNKIYEKLPMMQSKLNQICQNKNDSDLYQQFMQTDPEEWLQWIEIIIYYNEPLALLIQNLDDFKFPTIQTIYDTFKIVEQMDPTDKITQEILEALIEFAGNQQRAFWGDICGAIGGAIGGAVGIGIYLYTGVGGLKEIGMAVAAASKVGKTVGKVIDKVIEGSEEEEEGVKVEKKREVKVEEKVEVEESKQHETVQIDSGKAPSWKDIPIGKWTAENVMDWAKEASELPAKVITSLADLTGEDLVSYELDDLKSDLELTKPIARKLFQKIQEMKSEKANETNEPEPPKDRLKDLNTPLTVKQDKANVQPQDKYANNNESKVASKQIDENVEITGEEIDDKMTDEELMLPKWKQNAVELSEKNYGSLQYNISLLRRKLTSETLQKHGSTLEINKLFLKLYTEKKRNLIVRNFSMTHQAIEENLLKGYDAQNEQRENRGKLISMEVYRQITEHSCIYDESGTNILSKDKFFFRDENQKFKEMDFQQLILPHVLKLVHYLGDFGSVVSSDLFVDDKQQQEFYYNGSYKIPITYTLNTCPNISEAMEQKFLENAFNPGMFVSYDQKALFNGQKKIQIRMASFYKKFKETVPNLLCIGSPKADKSTLLNELFGTSFEIISKKSNGLYHDGVDVIFDSKDFPLGFNIFDFQGFANLDHELISLLFGSLTQSMILVQLSDLFYFEQVLNKLSKSTKAQLADRTIFITKFQDIDDFDDKKYEVDDYYDNETDNSEKTPKQNQNDQVKQLFLSLCSKEIQDQNVIIFGDEKTGNAFISKKIKQLSNILQLIKDRKVLFEQDYDQNIIYKTTYGSYWQIEKSLLKNIEKVNILKDYKVDIINKSNLFREAHFEIKNILSNMTMEEQDRQNVFPYYMRYLQQTKINGKLADVSIKEADKVRLQNQLKTLMEQSISHGELYKKWLTYFLNKDNEICQDLHDQVETKYLPLIKEDKKKIEKLKKEAEAIQKKLDQLQLGEEKEAIDQIQDKPQPQLVKTNSSKSQMIQKTQEQIYIDLLKQFKDQIGTIMNRVEQQVLDSELFKRESKIFFTNPTTEFNSYDTKTKMTKKFKNSDLYAQLSNQFEAGTPIEIIDGDSNSLHFPTLEPVMQWVHDLKKNFQSLIVITIMGPQSSGKSTLMNFLFGSKFTVSAGRCTKGLNAMLIRTDSTNKEDGSVKEMLILDSEGIFSIERQDPMFDRKLCVFCMSISNMLLINIKGELNIEVQKVMEVAIFAMSKILESKAALKVPQIKFILRDQLESTASEMTAAYDKLKKSMTDAAQASGSILGNVINMPVSPQNVVFMFPSALQLDKINSNENLIVTRSQQVFRDKCSALRAHMLEFNKLLKQEQRVLDLNSWINDAKNVWLAVMSSSQLMVIKDLVEINNSRILSNKIGAFMKEMFQDNSQVEEVVQKLHPFLAGKEDVYAERYPGQQATIQSDQTVCSLFTKYINDFDEKGSNQATRDKQFEDHLKLLEFYKDSITKEELLKLDILVEEMGPNLSKQAKKQVENIIEQIFCKNLNIWKKSQSESDIDFYANEMYIQLQKKVTELRVEKKQCTQQQFDVEIQKIKQYYKSKIENQFKKQPAELQYEAKRDLIQLMENEMIGNQQNQKKDKNDNKKSESNQFSVFKQDYIPDKYGVFSVFNQNSSLPAKMSDYYEPIQALRDKGIKDLVDLKKVDLQCEIFPIQQQLAEKDGSWNPLTLYQTKQLKLNLKELETKYWTLDYEERNILEKWFKQQFEKDTQARMINFKEQIAIQVDKHNNNLNNSTETETFSEEIKIQLIETIKNELSQTAQRNPAKFRIKEDIMKCSINIKAGQWKQDFTQFMYNLLLKQAQRNEKTVLDASLLKLEQKAVQGRKYFDDMMQQITGVEDVAKAFNKVVLKTVSSLLQKVLFAKFSVDVGNTFIEKIQVQLESKTQFENAKDTPEDIELIYKHITAPIALETEIFQQLFKSRILEKEIEIMDLFTSKKDDIFMNITNYYNGLIESFGDDIKIKNKAAEDQDQVQKDKEIEIKEKLLMFIFANLFGPLLIEANNNLSSNYTDVIMNDIETSNVCQNKLQKHLSKLFTSEIIIQPQMYAEEYEYDAALLKNQAKNEAFPVNQIHTFIKFVGKIEQDSYDQIFKEAKEDLQTTLQQKITNILSSESALNQALGCRATCHFCGARCSSLQTNACNHDTQYHRPMAFNGTFQMNENNEKELIQDYCTSDFNIKDSWWKKAGEQSDAQSSLQRLRDLGCNTSSNTNILLKWDSGSDLDIQVMCACGIWHGYGCTEEGTSAGGCKCDKCEMYRDHDITTGSDDRAHAIEHVYFKNTAKIMNKQLCIGVYNYTSRTSRTNDQFQIGMFNRHGFPIWPPGGEEIKRKDEWKVNGTGTTFRAESFVYDGGMDNDLRPNIENFLAHKTSIESAKNWQFSSGKTLELQGDDVFQTYKANWYRQWLKVNERLCSEFNAKLLNNVI